MVCAILLLAFSTYLHIVFKENCFLHSTNIPRGLLHASLWLQPGDRAGRSSQSGGGDRNAHRLSSKGVRAMTEGSTGVCGARGWGAVISHPLHVRNFGRLLGGGDV